MSGFSLFEYKTEKDFKNSNGKLAMIDSDCDKLVNIAKSRCARNEIFYATIFYSGSLKLYAFIFKKNINVLVWYVFNNKEFESKLKRLCLDTAYLLKQYKYYNGEGTLLLYDNNGNPSIALNSKDNILIKDALSEDTKPPIRGNIAKILSLICQLLKPVNTVIFSTNISSTDYTCWDYSIEEPGAIRIVWKPW